MHDNYFFKQTRKWQSFTFFDVVFVGEQHFLGAVSTQEQETVATTAKSFNFSAEPIFTDCPVCH
jgi:hypothetical protein